jgi:maltose alpha-D-glucosyltransferase/alpha-amylase
LINSLLFSMPGTPIIYYGDEIGMGDNFYLGDRDGVRTPMQWNQDRNAGFSEASAQKLFLPVIHDSEYHFTSLNVEVQQGNAASLMNWMRRMLQVRRQSKAFAVGTLEFLHPENSKIVAFLRQHESEVLLVIANLSRHTQYTEVDISGFAGRTPLELFGRASLPEIKPGHTPFTLGPYGFIWLSLEEVGAGNNESLWVPPLISGQGAWGRELNHTIERSVLRI